jgi:transcriptional regulator with XRE-family HTH domain
VPRVNGKFLKQLIRQKDLTQEAVARRAKITPGALSKILHGRVGNTASSTVDALASCLSVQRSALVVDPFHDPDPRPIEELRSMVAQSSSTIPEALRPKWMRKSRPQIVEAYVRLKVCTPQGEVDAVEHLAMKASRSATRTSLLGSPGAGKTTVARMLALSLATAPENEGPLPVPLPVRELCGTDEPTFSCVERYYRIRGLAEALTRVGARGELVLLLDGFDEVADPIAALRAVQRASRDAGTNPIILTSRVEGYRSPNSDFEECELLAFGRVQQEELFAKWIPEDDRIGRTLDQLSVPHLDDIQRSPLLLTILAYLMRADPTRALPSGTLDLIGAYRAMLIRRLHAPPGEEGAVVDEAKISLVVKVVAALSARRGDDTFSRLNLLDWLQEATSTANPKGDDLLTQVLRTGLIVTVQGHDHIPGGDFEFEFLHRIVRDAIAAEYYAERYPAQGSWSGEWSVLETAVFKLHPAVVSFTASVLGARLPEDRDKWLRRLLRAQRELKKQDGRDARFSLITQTNRVGFEALVDFLVEEYELVWGADSLKARLGSEVLYKCLQGLLDDARHCTETWSFQMAIDRFLDIARLVAQETTDGNDLWVVKEALDEVIQWEAQGNGREKRGFIPSHMHTAMAGHMEHNLLAYPEQRRREHSRDVAQTRLVASLPDAEGGSESALRAVPSGFVTNGEFARFDPGHRDRLRGELASDADPADQAPVVLVSWFEAALFAKSVGGRLPRPEELNGDTESASADARKTACVLPRCEWTAIDVAPSFSANGRTSVWGPCYEGQVGERPASPSWTRLARGRYTDIGFRVLLPTAPKSVTKTTARKGGTNV